MFRYVFFDLYGTLVDIQTDEGAPETTRAFEAWVARTHGPRAAAREAASPLGAALCSMRPPPHAWGEPDIAPVISAHMSAVLERPATPEEVAHAAARFRACSLRHLALVAGALETLEALAPRVRVGLISNAQTLFTLPEIVPLGLTRLLSPMVISSDVGVRKPSPRIFEVALARAGVPASDALHVGNDPLDDIDGAHEAGLRTCLVDDGRSRPPGKHRADLHCPSVAGLAAVLGFGSPA
jgi:putative hydrolase of the HAD superfamily